MNRRKYLRWILLETVHHFIRKGPIRTNKYTALKKKKGSNTAKVILARDMLKAIYHVMKQKRPFYRSKQENIKSGLGRLSRSFGTEVPVAIG